MINDEGMVPVYDVIHTMCDQVNGRLTYIAKNGKPSDMDETFATLIHAAPKPVSYTHLTLPTIPLV